MFKCDCCGICCKNILLSTLYEGLDRGDGTCKFFNDKDLLCSIYETRPIECNVDETYYKFFSSSMSKDEYYELNYLGCKALKKQHNR